MKITEVTLANNTNLDALKKGLNSFNEKHTGSHLNEKVSSFVIDAKNKTIAGIVGEINWGWLYIQGLWVSDAFRMQGLGTQLLQKLEGDALTKGITNFRLETTSFQALGFYQKHGYTLFATLPDMPPTFTSYFLKKHIVKNK